MIRIGTSSWADPEFVRDWYPPKLPAAARLSWYAEHFDYVEVNSTFYAVPVKKVVNRWDSETPLNFLFDVKLHGLLSRHAVKTTSLPPDIRRDAEANPRGNLILTSKLERLVAERILAEVEPLREAGKLGAFLLQLSLRFRHSNISSMSLINSLPCFEMSGLQLSCVIGIGLRSHIEGKPWLSFKGNGCRLSLLMRPRVSTSP